MTKLSTEYVHLGTSIVAHMWRRFSKTLNKLPEHEHKTVNFANEAIHTQNLGLFSRSKYFFV